MSTIAHSVAVTCYIGAAALAATPFARPVRAPVRGVVAILALGVLAHGAALLLLARSTGQAPLTGLGPALSFAGFVLALILLLVELTAGEVSLALAAAPLAAVPTVAALIVGLRPAGDPSGAQGVWLVSHIALSFVGIAALATAAAAGTMYLVERRELRSRRFGAVFRFFPPLETLDRVNHVAAVAAWVALTLGVVLAVTYSATYRDAGALKLIWALGAWAGATGVAVGRVLGGWRARRAAVASSVVFAAVVALYLAFRVAAQAPGRFL